MALTTLTTRNQSPYRGTASRDFDRFFNELFYGARQPAPFKGARAPREGFVPRVDVTETATAYTVTAELPGVDPAAVDVVIEEGVLTLRGEKANSHEGAAEGLRRVESTFGSFERRLRFGTAVDEANVKASFKNGVLEVTLPKPPEAQPQVRTVPIETP